MHRAAFVLLIVGASGLACGRPSEGRERRDFERMRQQQRYDTYGPSSFFHNGAVMQAPPAHTIPRAADDPWSGRVQAAAYLSGASGGSDVTAPPIPVDANLLAAGRAQYEISCAPCHGPAGFGGGVMAANLTSKRPPSLRTPPISTLPAGTIFKIISDGFGRMPPYGWQLPADSRWAVVAYVRSLATTPATAAARIDSANAEYLRQLDSTHSFAGRLQMHPPTSDSLVR
jgi:mono/diheme cytochrome c family protein